jgi:electron transport complex protein RnfG
MKDVLRMVLVLGVVCVVAALGLARVYELTKAPIAEAKRQEVLRAIRAVLPPFSNEPDRDRIQEDGRTYYPGRAEGRLTGVAIPVSSAEGYGGTIEALVGVDPDGVVTGVAILAHAETPGLGAKAANPGYLAQFKGKSLSGARWAVKKDGGDFDQITGATITPRALVSAIRKGLEGFEQDRGRLIAAVPGDTK